MTKRTDLCLPPPLPRKVAFLTFAILACGFIYQPVSASDQENINRQQEKVERVRKSILDHQEKLSSSNRKELEIIRELKKIDNQILVESRKYVNLEQQIQEQEDLIAEQQQHLDTLETEKENLKIQVQKRLTAYYQMGRIGLINAIFSTSSLTDLLHFREMYEQMLKHDKELFTAFKSKIHTIGRIKKVLEQERQKLKAAVSQARAQQNILADKRRERERLLERVKTQKALYHNALDEMKEASRELQMTLADLKGRTGTEGEDGSGPITEIKKTRPPSKKGFAGRKGHLSPPVSGEVIKKFRKEAPDDGEVIFSEGINIRTEPGDKIKAVYNGEVIYAGMLPGYGKMIILDHGNHYISLVSGIAEFIKEVGDLVEEGEIIATASYHSGLLQDGIHFEIRHETEPIDPLAWLDLSTLKIK